MRSAEHTNYKTIDGILKFGDFRELHPRNKMQARMQNPKSHTHINIYIFIYI